jgi:hypothetical protein
LLEAAVIIACRPVRDRFVLSLFIIHRVDGRRRSERLDLGSVGGQKTPPERIEYWALFGDRWRAIAAGHPDISAEDADRVRAEVEAHVPPPRTARERKLLARAIAERAVIATAAGDNGWAFMDAALTLVRLMPDCPVPPAALSEVEDQPDRDQARETAV